MSDNSNIPLPNRLLTPKETGKIVGRSEHTLATDRVYGTGITFVKIGGRVMYSPADINAYIARSRRISTSQD